MLLCFVWVSLVSAVHTHTEAPRVALLVNHYRLVYVLGDVRQIKREEREDSKGSSLNIYSYILLPVHMCREPRASVDDDNDQCVQVSRQPSPPCRAERSVHVPFFLVSLIWSLCTCAPIFLNNRASFEGACARAAAAFDV